jgi:tetratricopeptide (TPR) repeat protein
MYDASDEAISNRLEELGHLETVSPFSRAFYGLIADLLTQASPEGNVRLPFVGLLEVELRYHRELEEMAEREAVSIEDLRSVGEKYCIGLESVREFSTRLTEGEGLAAAVRHLVLAECNYHLHRTEAVVAALERAVQLGIRQPLTQFALGYNRYLLALEAYTEPGEKEGERLVRDPLSFQVQCLQAAGAFEEGLTGRELDAELYWWIGNVLEAAGLTEAAQDAYDKSAALFADERHPREQERFGPRRAEEGEAAISEEEVRWAGEMLKGSFSPSEILRGQMEEGC